MSKSKSQARAEREAQEHAQAQGAQQAEQASQAAQEGEGQAQAAAAPIPEQPIEQREVSVNEPPINEDQDPDERYLPMDVDVATGRQIPYLIQLDPCTCADKEGKQPHIGGVYYKPEDEKPAATAHFICSVIALADFQELQAQAAERGEAFDFDQESVPIKDMYMSAKLFPKKGAGGKVMTSRLGFFLVHHFGLRIDRTRGLEDQCAEVAGHLQAIKGHFYLGFVNWEGGCNNQSCENFQIKEYSRRIRGSRRFPEKRDAEGNIVGRENHMDCACGGVIRAQAEVGEIRGVYTAGV